MNLKSAHCAFADLITVTDNVHDGVVLFEQQHESAPSNGAINFP